MIEGGKPFGIVVTEYTGVCGRGGGGLASVDVDVCVRMHESWVSGAGCVCARARACVSCVRM